MMETACCWRRLHEKCMLDEDPTGHEHRGGGSRADPGLGGIPEDVDAILIHWCPTSSRTAGRSEPAQICLFKLDIQSCVVVKKYLPCDNVYHSRSQTSF